MRAVDEIDGPHSNFPNFNDRRWLADQPFWGERAGALLRNRCW
jgi:hypothetical protein